MNSSKESSKRIEEGVRRYSQGHGSQWVESDDDDEPALYCTDDFRMRCMKVLRCSKKYCHDWTRCPFAHPGEKATRRDPMHGVYTGIACPDMRRDQRCPRGHYCPYAHNVFEYWLHPTRYRTALCRDVERCSRKICFFAHEVHEIRTNVERPYVSPQQLVAATEAAALDPRVQAEFQAAKEQSSHSKPGLMTGMFNTLDGPVEGEGYDSTSLTLPAPWASQENQEVSNALSSLMRGAAGPMPKPYPMQSGPVNHGSRLSGNFKSLPPPVAESSQTSALFKEGMNPDLRVRRSLSDPASKSGASQASDEQPSGQPQKTETASHTDTDLSDLRTSSTGKGLGFWPKDDQPLATQSSTQTAPAGQKEERVQTMYPNHLNTMVQMPSHQSWGGQQNLMNAAAHLMDAKEMPGGGLWSTPRGPLENPLYSTSSSISERQSSLEGPLANRLDAVYKQKLRKRQAKRQGRDVPSRLAYPQPYAPQPPIFSNNPNLLSQYPANTPKDPYSNLPTIPNFWSDSPGMDMAQAYQQQQQRQQQAVQAQNYLQSMQEIQLKQQQQQRQLHAMEQLEAQFQLQQAIEHELRKLNSNQGGGSVNPPPPAQHPKQEQSLRASLETSYDLRSSQLNDFQGLFSNPRETAPVAQPASLQSQFSSVYPNPSRLHSGQAMGGLGAEGGMGRHMSGLEPGLRGKDPLYGYGEGEARGAAERGEQEAFYKSPTSLQPGGPPNLEDIFSRMSLERGATAQGPASSGGQGRGRE